LTSVGNLQAKEKEKWEMRNNVSREAKWVSSSRKICFWYFFLNCYRVTDKTPAICPYDYVKSERFRLINPVIISREVFQAHS